MNDRTDLVLPVKIARNFVAEHPDQGFAAVGSVVQSSLGARFRVEKVDGVWSWVRLDGISRGTHSPVDLDLIPA